jgi:hypothetical protein
MQNNSVICKGRFMVDVIPQPTNGFNTEHIYKWSVIDFDEGDDYSGFADSMLTARLEAITKVRALRDTPVSDTMETTEEVTMPDEKEETTFVQVESHDTVDVDSSEAPA